jgi:hypothetical protein
MKYSKSKRAITLSKRVITLSKLDKSTCQSKRVITLSKLDNVWYADIIWYIYKQTNTRQG